MFSIAGNLRNCSQGANIDLHGLGEDAKRKRLDNTIFPHKPDTVNDSMQNDLGKLLAGEKVFCDFIHANNCTLPTDFWQKELATRHADWMKRNIEIKHR